MADYQSEFSGPQIDQYLNVGKDVSETEGIIASDGDGGISAVTIGSKLSFTGGELDVDGDLGGVPVGMILPFAGPTVPAGYLLCNGSAVGRETYPELFTVIGTTYGSGDGSTTFNLPNLINKFIEGANAAGTEYQAGLPNIEGSLDGNPFDSTDSGGPSHSGALYAANQTGAQTIYALYNSSKQTYGRNIRFNASICNPIYGNSSTVQPAAVSALPCIKAFSSVVDDSTVEVSELVNDIEAKVALDGSNTSSIGSTLSTYIAHAAMPSGQYEDLTLPASGGTVTAPADGWIVFQKQVNASGQHISLLNQTSSVSIDNIAVGSTNKPQVYLPVMKNDIITIAYTAAGTLEKFRFVYANGSAPTV